MVIASSTWVRPAQALIYSESGEVKCFPPRNRGRLPRALTFGDHHQDWRHNMTNQHGITSPDNQQMSPFELSEQVPEQDSILITSQCENFQMEDPPEEYSSFEVEYSRNSMARDVDSYSCVDQEAPSMSTPTEQYMNNVLKRKGLPQQSLSSKKQPYYSTAADTQDGCMSPLLQTDSGPYLSLDDLVDLYAKKLEAAKSARLSKGRDVDNISCNSINEPKLEESSNNGASNDSVDRICNGENNSEERNHKSVNCESQNQSAVSVRNSLQLMTFDIHLLLEKLDKIYIAPQDNSEYEDWLCISMEEFESILMDCSKETIEFVLME